jgi:hypothetical protein
MIIRMPSIANDIRVAYNPATMHVKAMTQAVAHPSRIPSRIIGE